MIWKFDKNWVNFLGQCFGFYELYVYVYDFDWKWKSIHSVVVWCSNWMCVHECEPIAINIPFRAEEHNLHNNHNMLEWFWSADENTCRILIGLEKPIG